MTEEAWRRHANPWSVYTRFAAIPAMILAIWSRIWIGWWALVPVFAVMIWCERALNLPQLWASNFPQFCRRS